MEFNELIQQRRSVRRYQDRPVARETIEEILRAAQLAPSWKNSQTARYYVVTGERADELRHACLPEGNCKKAEGAALIVTTFVRAVSGHTQGQPDNEPGDEWGAFDLGLAVSYLILKAKDLGLDTLIMGLRDGQALRGKLSIPDSEEIMAVLALGYRDEEPALRPRKQLEEVAFF